MLEMGREALQGTLTGDLLSRYVSPRGDIAVPDHLTVTSFLSDHAAAERTLPSYRFIDYSTSSDGEVQQLSWTSLEQSVRAVAARLLQVCTLDDRVAILAPQGLSYAVGFFAAIHAGTIAVPLFVPTLSGQAERLASVLADAEPRVVLTTASAAQSVRKMLRNSGITPMPRVIDIDSVPISIGEGYAAPDRGADDVAYLQYTSGSTRTPAGVEITHRAVCTNVAQMILAGDLGVGIRSVSWLPLYHDMGLMMIMFPMLCGGQITLMDPMAFIRRPSRWIQQLAAESVHGRTFAAAPNFAFSLCAQRGRPPAGQSLDLTNVVGLLNGSEPVTIEAIDDFTTAFGPYGLPPTAVKPSYGLAEATLSVASIGRDATPTAMHLDRAALSDGHAVGVDAASPDKVTLVSCGQPIPNQWLVIVDGATGEELPDGVVGEIWIHGNNIGRGYWGKPEESDLVFGNKLQRRLDLASHAEGVPDNGKWLATGDLGVYLDGELYITGRSKDLLIIDGRNHYPVDIETTVSQCTNGIRDGYVAAFALDAQTMAPARPGAGERLVVVAERAMGASHTAPEAIHELVRAAVARTHQLTLGDFRLVPAGAIPRTTSGKLARTACRDAYLAGDFD